MLGLSLGALEIDGMAVGKEVGALPHSISESQRIQTSALEVSNAPFLILLALNPPQHVQIG